MPPKSKANQSKTPAKRGQKPKQQAGEDVNCKIPCFSRHRKEQRLHKKCQHLRLALKLDDLKK